MKNHPFFENKFFVVFFKNSLHERLNSHYDAWSYKKKNKMMKPNKKPV